MTQGNLKKHYSFFDSLPLCHEDSKAAYGEAHVGRNWDLLPTISTLWVNHLEADSTASVKSWDDCSPDQYFDYNFMRHPEP